MIKLKQKNTGFTLVELLVVLAVVGIILLIAVPRMRVSPKGKVVTAANELLALAKFTKATALKNGQVSELCVYDLTNKKCQDTLYGRFLVTESVFDYTKFAFGAGKYELSATNPAQRVIPFRQGLTYKVDFRDSLKGPVMAPAVGSALFRADGSRKAQGGTFLTHEFEDDGSYASSTVDYPEKGFMAAIYCIQIADSTEIDPDINKPWQRQVVISELGDIQLYKECSI